MGTAKTAPSLQWRSSRFCVISPSASGCRRRCESHTRSWRCASWRVFSGTGLVLTAQAGKVTIHTTLSSSTCCTASSHRTGVRSGSSPGETIERHREVLERGSEAAHLLHVQQPGLHPERTASASREGERISTAFVEPTVTKW